MRDPQSDSKLQADSIRRTIDLWNLEKGSHEDGHDHHRHYCQDATASQLTRTYNSIHAPGNLGTGQSNRDQPHELVWCLRTLSLGILPSNPYRRPIRRRHGVDQSQDGRDPEGHPDPSAPVGDRLAVG